MKMAKIIDFEITSHVTCLCPHCKKELKLELYVDPYRIPADEMPDELCPDCDKFFSMTLYDIDKI